MEVTFTSVPPICSAREPHWLMDATTVIGAGRLLRGGLLGLRAAAGAAGARRHQHACGEDGGNAGDQTMRVNVHIAAFFEYAVDGPPSDCH